MSSYDDRPRRRPRVAGERARRRPPTPAQPDLPAPAAPEGAQTAGGSAPGGAAPEAASAAPEAAGAPGPTYPAPWPAPAADPDRPARRAVARAAGRGVAVMVVVVLVLAAAAAVLGSRLSTAQATADARAAAVQAAMRAAGDLLSYNWETLDDDIARAEREMTTRYRTQEYAKTVHSVVEPTAKANHAKVSTSVSVAGARSAGPDKVVVLLFVDTVSTNDKRKNTPRFDQNRVRLTMVRQGGRWLVDDVAAI